MSKKELKYTEDEILSAVDNNIFKKAAINEAERNNNLLKNNFNEAINNIKDAFNYPQKSIKDKQELIKELQSLFNKYM